MQKRVLVLTTSAFILACGAIAASAQQGPVCTKNSDSDVVVMQRPSRAHCSLL
jgi:hypothetical protein